MAPLKYENYPYKVSIKPRRDDDSGQWLTRNVGGLWLHDVDEYYEPTFTYYFEHEADAVIFALKWSGKWQKN